mmetsp:Transcript_26411/g.69419  ORF Transcript_26411/g.69419 Transcript_26411/m.69419 type:complete len:256 (-) Transcript_26411:1721-2488(-)
MHGQDPLHQRLPFHVLLLRFQNHCFANLTNQHAGQLETLALVLLAQEGGLLRVAGAVDDTPLNKLQHSMEETERVKEASPSPFRATACSKIGHSERAIEDSGHLHHCRLQRVQRLQETHRAPDHGSVGPVLQVHSFQVLCVRDSGVVLMIFEDVQVTILQHLLDGLAHVQSIPLRQRNHKHVEHLWNLLGTHFEVLAHVLENTVFVQGGHADEGVRSDVGTQLIGELVSGALGDQKQQEWVGRVSVDTHPGNLAR